MATYNVELDLDVEADFIPTDREDRMVSIHLVSVVPTLSIAVVKVESPTP